VEERHLDLVSPSKTKWGNQAPKVTFAPTTDASAAAQRLLLSFVRTNTPASLFQALPRPRVNSSGNDSLFESDDHDSVVAKESLCIKDAKHCWAILKEGFVQRIKIPSSSLLVGKRKRGKVITGAEEYPEENLGNTVLAPVADHAWLVLQWLVELFQRDESLTSKDSSGRRHPLTVTPLTQIMCSEPFATAVVADSAATKRYRSSVGSRCTTRHRIVLCFAKPTTETAAGSRVDDSGEYTIIFTGYLRAKLCSLSISV